MLGWALATFVKDMKIRLRKNWLSILAEVRSPPASEIADGLMNFMINYDGYGFVLCMMCPTSCPSPTQVLYNPILYHNMYCHLTTNTQQHHYHYHIPHHAHQVSNATNTSTILAKCLAEHCASHWQTALSFGGGGGWLRHIFSDRFFFFFFLWQNYYHNGVGVLSSSPYVTELTSKKERKKVKKAKTIGGGGGDCPPATPRRRAWLQNVMHAHSFMHSWQNHVIHNTIHIHHN